MGFHMSDFNDSPHEPNTESEKPKGFLSPLYFRAAIIFDLTFMTIDGFNQQTASAVIMALFSFIMFRQNKGRFGRYW